MNGYFSQDNRICICFSYGLSLDNNTTGDLTLASGPGSIVDFWIGRGVLINHRGKLFGTIISKQQYKERLPSITTINVSTEFKTLSNNFESVELIE